MGRAEDELSDGIAKYTKLHSMRVEMFLHVQTKTCGDIKHCITYKNIAVDSGERTATRAEIILAVLNYWPKTPCG